MALEHGKHVLIEKPMAATLEDALKICEAAESKGLHVSCAPPNMLHPGQRRLMQLVSNGAIGEVSLVRTTCPAWGLGRVTERPPTSVGFIRAGPAECPAWPVMDSSR